MDTYSSLTEETFTYIIENTMWQAERMYTEEDLGKAFYAGANYQDGIYEEGFQNSRPTFEEWFELFKKNRHEKE